MPKFEEVGVEAVVKGFGTFQAQLNSMGLSIANTGSFASGLGGGFNILGVAAGVATAAVAALAAATAAAVAGITAIGVASVKTAIDVESAFAGVIKTTDGLTDDFGNLNEAGEEVFQGFRDLSKEIPQTVEELMGIGEIAGQLGVPKDALVDFTETVAALGETTNLTTDEAATALARLGNIYQISAEDMALNTQQVGSTLVALGNNFATTERDILNFAERIAGAGAIAGLTQPDILAIGTAMSSVGVEAEAGGTAVQKVLLAMTEAVTGNSWQSRQELQKFADAAGYTADEFKTLWEEEGPAMVFKDFVEGLGEQGDQAIQTLDELGLSDQRLVRAFLSLSNAGELLEESMGLAGGAFEENTALSKEAEARYRTTASQIQILKNNFRDMGITIGSALLPFLNDALVAIRPFIDELGERLPGIMEEQVIPAVEGFVDFAKSDLIPAFQNVAGFIGEEVVPRLMEFFETLKGLVSGEVSLSDILPPEVMDVINALVNGFYAISAWWEENGDSIKEQAGSLFDRFAEVAGLIVDEYVPMITEAIQNVSDWFEENGDQIKQVIDGWFTAMGTFVDIVLVLWETLKPVLSGIFDALLAIVDFWLNVATGQWEEAWNSIVEIATSLGEGILGGIENLINGVLELFGTSLPEAMEVWRTNFELLGTIIEAALSNAEEKITGFFGTIKTRGKELMEKFLEGIKEGFQAILDAISGLLSNIGSLISKVPGLGGLLGAIGIGEGVEAARGLDMTVPAGHPNDSFFLPLNLTSGERVIVQPNQASTAQQVQRAMNVEVNASYNYTQSPGTIADDLALLQGIYEASPI